MKKLKNEQPQAEKCQLRTTEQVLDEYKKEQAAQRVRIAWLEGQVQAYKHCIGRIGGVGRDG